MNKIIAAAVALAFSTAVFAQAPAQKAAEPAKAAPATPAAAPAPAKETKVHRGKRKNEAQRTEGQKGSTPKMKVKKEGKRKSEQQRMEEKK